MEEAHRQFIYQNYDEAIKAYSNLIESKPEDINLLLCRALCYIETAQYDLAIEDLEVADKVEFNNFQVYLRWGIALFYKGEMAKALKQFKAAEPLANAEYEKKMIGEWKQKCLKEQTP